ncbi:MAG: VTT domain-containing protein, partial [Acidaminococcaceae bacterium]
YLSHEQGFIRMLWLRTVPIFPYDPVSVVAGCSSMSYVPYAAATLVGMLPGALAYNFLAEAFVGTGGLTVGIVLTTVAFGLPMAWWYWGGERSKM